MLESVDGLISAQLFDGRGGGRELTWVEVRRWEPSQGVLWVNLDRTSPVAQQWLAHESGVRRLVVEALLAEETRPRGTAWPDGLLLNLRGINLNPGAEPNDLVSVRVWFEERRIITLRKFRLFALQDIRESLTGGLGPCTPGDFMATLTARLIDRMGGAIEDLSESVDEIEEEVLLRQSHAMRAKLSHFRRDVITLHRYLAPQRDALLRLQSEAVGWLSDANRAQLQEATDRLIRYIEDLNAARDRAAVTQEELLARLSERMESNMYRLSLVAGIFLPLGLLTGLLGINVGGMPGVESAVAFWVVCALLAGLAGLTWWLFKRGQWL